MNKTGLFRLFLLFLKIGSLSFGGFMALISVIEKEVVSARKIISSERLLEGISLATILPGPMAVNTVAFVGYNVRGIRGALIAMFGVIIPSFLLIYGLSFVYYQYGEVKWLAKVFDGFLPAVVAIIVTVAIGMTQKHIKNAYQVLICIASGLLLYFVGGFFMTLSIILLSGVLGWILFNEKGWATNSQSFKSLIADWDKKALRNLGWMMVTIFMAYVTVGILSLSNEHFIIYRKLLYLFSGLSVTLFGGGYVFIPMIQEIIVDNLGWLTSKEFADAIAMGQVTPGPIMISSTFIGYKMSGFLGALVSTVGIFLPSGLLMIICSDVFKNLKKLNILDSIYKGIRPAVIGMIFTAALIMSKSLEWHWLTLVIFVASLIAILRFKVNLILVIPLSGLIWYFIR